MQLWLRRTFLIFTAVAAISLAACGSISSSTHVTTPAAPSLQPLAVSSGSGDAGTLQDAYVATVRRVLPVVVQIRTDSGLGSGVVFDASGNVVTNAHVVENATSITVTSSTGHDYPAKLVGTFPADDIAVVHIDGANLAPAAFGDSGQLQVGHIVLAVGNPLGLQSSVTTGIVSAVGRSVSEGNGVTLPDTIQTSAEINPGNSGGALVDLSGQVIGIPTLAALDPQFGGGAAPGIGFAIPSRTVVDIAAQLISQGHVTNSHRAYLGVRLASSLDGTAVISSVTTGSPAEHAGLKAGDTITAVGDKSITGPESVSEALASLSPTTQVPITVTTQEGTRRTVTVTLGELPA